MGDSGDARLANLLGAVATGLTDAIQDAAASATQLDDSAAAGLVAMLDFTPAGSVQMLSQVLGLTHSGAVRLVNRLARAELVERLSSDDARSVTVRLTRPGRRVALRVRNGRRAAITAALAGLTEQQRDALTELCEVLVANVTKQRLSLRATGKRPAGGALCRLCDFRACGRPEGACPAAAAARDT